jgi:hypothetical protein
MLLQNRKYLGFSVHIHHIAIHPEIHKGFPGRNITMQNLKILCALCIQSGQVVSYLVTNPVLSLSIFAKRTVVKKDGILQSSLVTIRNSVATKAEKKRRLESLTDNLI